MSLNNQVALPVSGKWYSVAHGNGLWVAVGWTTGSAPCCAWSTDGITWNAQTSGGAWGYNVIYNSTLGKWLIVKNAAAVYTATDGKIWTQTSGLPYGVGAAEGGTARHHLAILSSTDTFITCRTFTAAAFLSSADGIAWTLRSLLPSANWNSFATNGTTVVAVGGTSAGVGVIYYSSETNALTTSWTNASGYSTTNAFYDVIWNGTYFFAVTKGQTAGFRSVDGITWEAVTYPVSYTPSSGLAATGEYGVMSSNDEGILLLPMAYGNGGDATTVVKMSCTNGDTWTDKTLFSSSDIWGTGSDGTKFVGVEAYVFSTKAIYSSSS